MEPDWVHLDTDENVNTMNSYFVQHPEIILDEMRMESTRFGTAELSQQECAALIKVVELRNNLTKIENVDGLLPWLL